MANSYRADQRPLCPVCGRERIHAVGSKQCRRCRYRPGWHTRDTPVPEPAAAPDVEPPLLAFEGAWQRWQRAIGMARDRYAGPPATTRPGRRQKILVMPDLHAPYHEEALFAAMLERERDADLCIGIGDISDAYALSRFTKYEWMPFRDEWASVTLVMQALSETFPAVELIIGNHDARLEKQIRTHLTQDMVEAIQFMTGGTLCPVTALAARYPNVTIARHATPGGQHIDWFTTIGDAWLGHPEKFSRVPGSAIRGVEEWLLDNELALGLDRYRLIVMGHTHAYSQLPFRAGTLMVECGCLCQTQGYMTSPRIGGRPQRRGYLTFEQVDGVTDLNSVRFHWFDAERHGEESAA